MLSPRRTAQLGLASAMLMWVLSMGLLIVRPLMEKPLPFAEPGTTAPDFALRDTEGRSVSLSSLQGQAVVLCFTSARNPNCMQYHDRIEAIARRYRADARVRFYAVNVDPNADALEVRVDAKIVGRSFPTLVDPAGQVAARYSIIDTPQIAIVDPSGLLRYRGPVDDNAVSEQV